MSTSARLPIAADRAGACVRTLQFVGLDLTGVTLAMQIRLAPDTPGAPLVNLTQQNAANAEGLFLAGVTVTNGLPTSNVQLRVNETTLEDNTKIPYFGELGDPSVLSYALIGVFGGDKRTLAYGPFVALPTTYGSDAAPANRPSGYGANGAAWATWTSAQLTFSNDAVSVVVDGADLLAPLVAQAGASATAAQGSAAAAGAARDQANAAAATSMAAGVQVSQAEIGVHNLFDQTTITPGYINNGQATINANAGLFVTAPIFCRPGGQVTFSSRVGQLGQGVQFFSDAACTQNVGYIDGPIAAGTTITIPSKAAGTASADPVAFRVSVSTQYTAAADLMIVRGPTLPAEYIPFGAPSRLADLRQAVDVLAPALWDATANKLKYSRQAADPRWQVGFIGADGQLHADATWVTATIKVSANGTTLGIKISSSTYYYFTRADERRVGGDPIYHVTQGDGGGGDSNDVLGPAFYPTPAGASYLTFSFPARLLRSITLATNLNDYQNQPLPIALDGQLASVPHVFTLQPARMAEIRQHYGARFLFQGHSMVDGNPAAGRLARYFGLSAIDVVARGGRTCVDIMQRYVPGGSNVPLTAADFAAVDLTILFLGTNDVAAGIPLGTVDDAPVGFNADGTIAGYSVGSTTFASVVLGWIKQITAWKRSQRVLLLTPLQRFDGGVAAWPRARMRGLRDLIVQIAEFTGQPYLDLYSLSGVNQWSYPDLLDAGGIHPKDGATYEAAIYGPLKKRIEQLAPWQPLAY